MRAAGILTRHIEPFHRGAGIGIDHHTAHEIMRGWHHLDQPASQIEAAIGAAFDHAGELGAHILWAKMRHGDKDAPIRRSIVLAHLGIDGAADHIAGRALALGVIVKHKAVLCAVEKLATRTAQPLFQHRSGHARMVPRQEARGMELHHFHVTQFQPRTQRHGEAIHRFVTRGGVVFVHRRPATGCHQHRLGPDKAKAPCTHIDEQHPRNCAAVARGNKAYGAVFL